MSQPTSNTNAATLQSQSTNRQKLKLGSDRTEKCVTTWTPNMRNLTKQITADFYSLLYLIIYFSNGLTYNLCWDWFEIEVLWFTFIESDFQWKSQVQIISSGSFVDSLEARVLRNFELKTCTCQSWLVPRCLSPVCCARSSAQTVWLGTSQHQESGTSSLREKAWYRLIFQALNISRGFFFITESCFGFSR